MEFSLQITVDSYPLMKSVWLKNKRVILHGCKFHWRLHYSQSRDGSPPFGGAIAVMSLLPGAALNIRM